jgi:hypothetical protein
MIRAKRLCKMVPRKKLAAFTLSGCSFSQLRLHTCQPPYQITPALDGNNKKKMLLH